MPAFKKDVWMDKLPGAIPRKKRVSKKKIASGPKEATIQAQVENYCHLHGLKFIRVPDTVYRVIFADQTVPIWTKKHISEYLKGITDMTILKSFGKYNKALLLEVKRNGGKVSQGQKNFHSGLNVVVAEGFQECKNAIDLFMQEP